MKLAFCLFNYFPYGGLQRDFMRIAKNCLARGHDIHVFTMRWEGPIEPQFHLHLLETKGWQNHVRARAFAKQVKNALAAGAFDLVIGFNKMPHLDIYYAADVCYLSRVLEERGRLMSLLPRYHAWVELEKAVFAKGVKTKILLISAKQQAEYIRHYQTEASRFTLLPPGIARDRVAPVNAAEIKQAVRAQYKVRDDDIILLMVGSGFKTKGVDRSIRALAALPDEVRKRCRLWVIGKDDPAEFITLAKSLNVASMLTFLGARDDVGRYLLAADLLLHPSYHENTGTVLLEAMAAGLPVLTVDTCGYAFYVTDAKAGFVVPSPFRQTNWNQSLLQMLQGNALAKLGKNGFEFAQHADIYSLPEKAADFIEMTGCEHDILSR